VQRLPASEPCITHICVYVHTCIYIYICIYIQELCITHSYHIHITFICHDAALPVSAPNDEVRDNQMMRFVMIK